MNHLKIQTGHRAKIELFDHWTKTENFLDFSIDYQVEDWRFKFGPQFSPHYYLTFTRKPKN